MVKEQRVHYVTLCIIRATYNHLDRVVGIYISFYCSLSS